MDTKKVKTRFAPSPTGYLHVGGARTALFNYAFAKRMGGDFIVRIDDTDMDRHVDDATSKLLADLKWLGLTWDNPLNDDGTSTGPVSYRQSDRLAFYTDYAKLLVDKGLAYYCFLPDNHDGDKKVYRDLSTDSALSRIASGDKPSIRFKVPTATDITVYDLIRGKVTFNTNVIDDFVILRSNGLPTYNFATVIDDHLMDISHVIRADEHLNNTLPQILVYKALGWDLPAFAHISLILAPDRTKLSKRHGAASVGDFRDLGYLPDAMNNYLSLLGWSHPKQKDIFPFKDLLDNFALKKVNPAPAIFDVVKLNWMNGMYLRNLDKDVTINLLKNNPLSAGIDLSVAVDLFKTKATTLKDYDLVFAWTKGDFDFKVTDDSLNFLKSSGKISAVLDHYLAWLDSSLPFVDFVADMKAKDLGGRDLFWTLRIGAIGDYNGPDNKLLTDLIPRAVLVDRARKLKSLIS
jgi:glutamyl-tRNA synthetase